MRRLVYMAALALVATLGVAPGATAQQMNDDHMMDDGQMMDANMLASPSASATSNSPSATTTASATASAPRGHHGGGGSSASAAVGSRLPSTGGVPLVSLVSVGALVLLVGFGLAAARLLRRSI
jgi:hypothetical protein